MDRPNNQRPWRACALLAGLLVLSLLSLWVFQRALVFPAPSLRGSPGPLSIPRPDGVVLRGWHIQAGSSALVVFGGNAMPLSGIGHWLASCTGRSVWLVPYRGYEGNPGRPTEHSLIEDGRAVFDAAARSSSDVAVLGISVGTGVAMGVATARPVSRLALALPFDRLSAVVHDHLPFIPEAAVFDRFDNAAIASRVRAPTFILQAAQDDVVYASRTEGLVAAFPVAPTVTRLPGTHNGVWESGSSICRWMGESLGSATSN